MKNLITYLSKKSLSLGNGSGMTRKGFEIGSVYSRLSLGSNLSRISLASLICLCMLTIGVGNVWGAETYSWTCSGSTVFSTSGSELNGITWKASITGTSQGTGVSGEKCVQIAKSNGLTLETTDFNNKNITAISIQTWGKAENSFALKDGDKQLATMTIPKSYSSNGAKIDFSNVGVIGEKLVFSWESGESAFNVLSITVTYETATAQNTIKWNVKGTEHQTTFDGQNTDICQLTDDEKKCGEKDFIGWTATNDYENETNAPDDLFITELPNGVTEGTTFYAVYADNQKTTTITYTWDLLKESTTPKLAVGDQIVITAKEYGYALSTTENKDTRGAVAVTKNGNSITINDKVQIFTIENGNVEGTFALATGDGYLSGTRRKAGWQYYNQLITADSKSANASWYIGFTEETTPYIYNEVTEKKEYPNYYVGFNDDWWTGTYYFEAVRDASTWYDYNPKNISIYRKTQHTTTTTVNSGYTTDCGCSAPADLLAFSNQTITADKTLTLEPNAGTGNGGTITYTCSDATNTTINDNQFSANALGTYTITATQGVNDSKCGAIVDFKVTVDCAKPSITPTTYETTINTPVDLKSIITSTSPMPLTFACTNKNVYISGTNFTFLAAGDYTITAKQEAGGIYCEGSQNITITVKDPCASKTKPTVTEDKITTDGFTLSWSEITGVSTYRVYNNTTGDSDETSSTSYTFSGLNPSTEYRWTVEAVYSDGCTAATSGTTTTSKPVVTYTVNWNVAGSSYTTGTPTTSVIHGEKVSALPTAPNPAEHSCGDKEFVGWSKSQYLDGSRPTDLFTKVEDSPVITAATTFYAVFADCVTGGDTPEDDTQGKYTLVTDVNDLQVGDKIIIACYSKEKAAGDLTSAILSVDDVTFSNNGNTLTPSARTLIFTLGGSPDAWTLANSSGQLLGATAVKTLAWGSGTTNWKISISGNNATIQNGTSSYGRFLYNEGSPRFTTYTSGTSASMLLPQIYKKTGSGSGGGATPEPTEYTVTLSVLGKTSEENTTSNYTLPIDVDASCAGKTFVGWTTTAELSSPTEPTSNYWAKGTPVTITENKTYYAVFAEGTNTFEWVTTGVESGADYLLAGYYDDKDYVLKNTLDSYGYIETDNIDAIDNVITTLDNSLIWTIAGNSTLGYYIYNPASDKYLNIDNPFTLDGTAETRYSITMSKNAEDYVQSYIKYENNYCSLYDNNNKTIGIAETEASIYLYKRAYSNFSTTCDGSGGTPNPDPDPEPTGNAYMKVTSSLDDYSGDYLIVYEDGGVAFNGELVTLDAVSNTISVTISNNAIAATGETNAAKFTIAKIDGGYSILSASGNYIGITKYENGLIASTSTVYANSISVSDGVASISLKFAGGTVTLQYNNVNTQNRFRYYKSEQQSIALYKLNSTSASAPARKVAMKKVAAVRAEKSEMVTRPVVKAPAALAAQGCTSYENYTTICCATPITDLKFAAGANSITLYWNTKAASATATLYSDEACKIEVATQSDITNGTCTFTGLAKTTTYYAKVSTTDGCTAVLEVSTERPHVSVAEWAANQINIDVNTNEPITVVLENEVTGGGTTSYQATELFFSKYYEATANVKLVAVYNGKKAPIDLTNYTIKYGKTSWATNYIPLAEFATTANGFALEGSLSPGEEMILYTKNVNDNRDVAIMECVTESYPDGKWIEVTTNNNTGGGSLSFGGDKTIALFKGETMIDIIGGGTASKPDNSGANTIPTWGDAKGWTCDEGLSIDDGTMIGISTNRCLLVRNNTVTSGDNAVSQNEFDFVTLCTEWKGAHVPDDATDDGVAASCENFAFVGTFDYSDYYVKYEELAKSDELPTEGRLSDGTYKVTTPDLHAIACTNMRISLKDAGGKTLVTQDLKVPIIVDQDIKTNDPIYFQYPQRDPQNPNTPPTLGNNKNENVLTPDICAECDVVIRDSKQLTHVANGVSEFNNMMVYPGAKFYNSTSQAFNLNTLQMQGQNDAVSYAIINNDGSTIDVGDMVFVKRIDAEYWYNFSLPYDCKVADIIQQNGQSMGKYWVDWGIKEYDGKVRQEAGTSAGAGNVGLHWKKVEETATLKAHQGYIIGLFTTEWTNQMKFVYFTPTKTNPYRESADDAKNTTIDSWYTTKEVAARHRGWNFTGSPYISRFGQSKAYQGLNNTSLIMTGYPDPENSDETSYTTYTDNVYVTIPSTPGGKYYSHYMASEVELLPFTAYFVQAADVDGSTDKQRTLTYAKDNRALPTSAPARTPAATKQRVLAELLVTAPDGQTDNTGVWVDERYTPEYEIAADLGKMYVAGAKPQLYTLAANGDMMAYHALPDASAMNIPLRLYAPEAGDYTLTLNKRVSRLAGAERVELLYNNAVVANMMIQDYTITANRGTVNGYSLSITRRADVSTAIDNITGTTITVIANDGYISVTDIPTDAQVSVYDMLGRLLATQSANGQTVVNIPAVPQGVYNIVVGNHNGHTTIKTVIR